MRKFPTIVLLIILVIPQVSISCEIKSGEKIFTNAFLSADINKMAKYYKEGTLFSIETDNNEAMAKQTTTTKVGFKNILSKYLQYQPFRKVPEEIKIEKNKIIYGGNNYTSYHHHWSLREIGFKCIENEFKVTNIFLIDGM